MKLQTFTRSAGLAALGVTIALGSANIAGACDAHGSEAMMRTSSQELNIVETAAAAGDFETLLTAAKAAGLAGLLQSDGPFTVLAPTDAAFAKLPKGTIKSLLEPANKDQLASILKYHVIAGRATSTDVAQARKIETALGPSIRVSSRNGELQLGNAGLVATDIEASNGIIHVIDTVLMPPSDMGGYPGNAMDLIDLAIDRGVPMFNGGDHAGCAVLYEMTAESLVRLGSDQIPARTVAVLDRTLREANRTHDASDRAWVLRRGLDRAYQMMSTSASGH